MTKSFKLILIFSLLNMVLYSQNTGSNHKVSFLQPIDSEIIPSANSLKNSLIALDKQPLKPVDIANITRAFAYSNNKKQDALLLNLNSKSKDLAETLLIFRNRLSGSISQEENVQKTVQEVFMHYVTNTIEGTSMLDSANPEGLFELLRQYSQSLGLDIYKTQNDGVKFVLADRTEMCEYCSLNTFSDLREAGIRVNKMRYGRKDVISARAFEFNGTGYKLQKAAIMADFCNLAYFNSDFIQSQLAISGYSAFHWIESENSDTEVFLTQKGEYQIICFRGTNSLTDIITDLRINKEPAYGDLGKVHSGFKNALDDVWIEIEKTINKDLKIIITGHSLGGALAQLLAYRLEFDNISVSEIYTYGSPRVGNYEFKESYDSRLAKKTYLHVNNKDVVPTIPFEIMGYKHLGNTERKFNSNHEISINNSEGNIIKPAEDLRFDELDQARQNDLQIKMDSVINSIKASTKFLIAAPAEYNPMAYGTDFKEGKVDDHGIYEYLFKIACAIVEKEMGYLKD